MPGVSGPSPVAVTPEHLGSRHWWSALLRCGSCRYLAIYFLPFYVAVLSTGHGDWGWIAFGVVFWLLHSFGTELVNRLADEEADRIDKPERTRFCDIVGYRRIKMLTRAIWTAVGVLYLGWLAVRPSWVLAFLLVAGSFFAINYSIGAHFKKTQLLCYIVLTFPFFGPFLIGWSNYRRLFQDPGAWHELVTRVCPMLAVVSLFIGTLVGAKDITDVEGDRRAGYESFFVRAMRSAGARNLMLAFSAPFFICLVYVISGALAKRYLLLLAFVPVSAMFGVVVTGARGYEQRAVTELLYQYWFAFAAAALFLYLPTWPAVATIAACAVYWVLTSQFLHWSDGIRMWKVRALLDVMRREPWFPSQVAVVASPRRNGNPGH
jgi:1,4-dihydroxy-2-naphthoate octaprenyltransferase